MRQSRDRTHELLCACRSIDAFATKDRLSQIFSVTGFCLTEVAQLISRSSNSMQTEVEDRELYRHVEQFFRWPLAAQSGLSIAYGVTPCI